MSLVCGSRQLSRSCASEPGEIGQVGGIKPMSEMKVAGDDGAVTYGTDRSPSVLSPPWRCSVSDACGRFSETTIE